jgi:hypothetical protein
MRARETLRILGGSILVYTAVATCRVAGSGTAALDSGTVDVSAPGSPDVSAAGGFDVSRVLDALTDPVPAAQAGSPQSGSRLKALYFVGADGSKQPVPGQIEWYDSQRGENCGFTQYADGNYYCLPRQSAAVGGTFADVGCTQPLVQAQAVSGCATPTTASTYTGTGSCSLGTGLQVLHIYQVGSLFTGTPYSGTPSSCNKTTAPSGYSLYVLGAEIPASSFVSATVQADQ